MGVVTRAFINQKHSVEDISTVLRNWCEVEEIDIDYVCSFFQVRFYVEGEKRCLSFHQNIDDYPLQGSIISMGADPLGKKIIQQLVEVFGGFYQEEDTSNSWEHYEGRLAQSNAHFVIDWAVKSKHTEDTTCQDAINAFEMFENLHGRF